MKKSPNEREWTIVASALSVSALVLTVISLVRLPTQFENAHKKTAQIAQLDKLAQTGARSRTARKAFESIENAGPAQLDGLLHSFAGGAAPEIHDAGFDKLEYPGWTRRSVKVNFPDINLNDLWMVLRQAESQRPPWRLASLEILASATTPGRGRAAVSFEVLTRIEE